ncbi:hypothetical protein V5799_020938 [Amblyomma americanum]|uniref:G-protein coupled receptors family 1 profile domain-containing protein n=1 Tax=Amblyomma americanum TaxID=6943 RepID=A0AAQ4ETA8_AMBAM
MVNASEEEEPSDQLHIQQIPDKYIGYIIHFMLKFQNDTSEFSNPQLRRTFYSSYPLFLVLYGSLFGSSHIANYWMVLHIYREKPFLCFASSIVQDFTFYLTLLTFVAIACDRNHRYAMNPMKRQIPPLLCLLGVCLVAGMLTLPYAACTKFLDLQQYLGQQFRGAGICAINLTENIEEYIRGLFIVLYALPVALVIYLHFKVSVEIKAQETSQSLALHARRESNGGEEASVCSLASSMVPESVHCTRSCATFPVATRDSCPRSEACRGASAAFYKDSPPEDSVDWMKERRTQNTVMMLATVYAVCLLPLNVLRFIVHVVHEGP